MLDNSIFPLRTACMCISTCSVACSCAPASVKMLEMACWRHVEEGQRVAVNPVESGLDLLPKKLTADA